MPKIPTIIDVMIFNPIWKLNIPPTKFIMKISNPPNIELNNIFIINFNGIAKTFAIISKKNIQAR